MSRSSESSQGPLCLLMKRISVKTLRVDDSSQKVVSEQGQIKNSLQYVHNNTASESIIFQDYPTRFTFWKFPVSADSDSLLTLPRLHGTIAASTLDLVSSMQGALIPANRLQINAVPSMAFHRGSHLTTSLHRHVASLASAAVRGLS